MRGRTDERARPRRIDKAVVRPDGVRRLGTEADWNDLAFYVKNGDAIERIAIVGDERWRDLMMMFASADLRRAPVEFFPERDLERARAWLCSGSTSQLRPPSS